MPSRGRPWAALYWWAVASYRGRPLARETATLAACAVNLGLWAAFQVLDEVFLAYLPEAVHRVIFVSQIATVLLVHLPCDQPDAVDCGPR